MFTTNDHTPAIPVITVTGTYAKESHPDEVSVTVDITAADTDRSVAWQNYQEQLGNLEQAVGTEATISERTPRQSTQEASLSTRTISETVLAGKVKVTVKPEAFGDLIVALVDNGFTFSQPDFSFSEKRSPDIEELEQAAIDARAKATAIAAGLGGRIGGIRHVTVGDDGLKITQRMANNLWAGRWMNTWQPPLLDRLRFSQKTTPLLRNTLFEMTDREIPVRDVVAEVTVTFELLSAA